MCYALFIGRGRGFESRLPRHLCTENTTAQEHANVPRGRKQSHGTKEKVHSSGNSIF